jgi:hypothetical protein
MLNVIMQRSVTQNVAMRNAVMLSVICPSIYCTDYTEGLARYWLQGKARKEIYVSGLPGALAPRHSAERQSAE